MVFAPRFTAEKDFEKYNVDTIMASVNQTNYSLYSCEFACRALSTITALALQNRDAEALADCLDGGVCEMLVASLNKHALESSIVASYACQAISNMTYGSIELREYLGEVGACEAVVYALQMNIGDSDTSEFGSYAIGMLAHTNISNSYRLAQAGACDCIGQIGNFGFNLRHPSCHIVSANVCVAAAELCEAMNAKQLLESGVGDVIVQLIRLHVGDKYVIFAGIKALCGLSSLNFDHREQLGRIGACDIIVDVMKKSNEITVLQDCSEAIMHLSLSPTNSHKLGQKGACETVFRALRDKLMEHNFGAEICSGALLNLCMYGISCKDNRAQLISLGGIELLRRTQMSTKASYRARENILQLLEILGADRISGPATLSSKNRSQQGTLVGVYHASEAKGDTRPLAVEVREYEEFRTDTMNTPSDAEDSTDLDDFLLGDSSFQELDSPSTSPIRSKKRMESNVVSINVDDVISTRKMSSSSPDNQAYANNSNAAISPSTTPTASSNVSTNSNSTGSSNSSRNRSRTLSASQKLANPSVNKAGMYEI